MYPAIALNKDNNGVIVFSLSSANDYPTAAFVTVNGTPSARSISRVKVTSLMTASPVTRRSANLVGRWGDYSAAAVNNVDNTLWMATEYVPDINRSSQANWATYVTRFQP